MADEALIWKDASYGPNNVESTTVNGYVVEVSLDDEGPLRPAFYWVINNVRSATSGWAASVEQARSDAVRCAREMP